MANGPTGQRARARCAYARETARERFRPFWPLFPLAMRRDSQVSVQHVLQPFRDIRYLFHAHLLFHWVAFRLHAIAERLKRIARGRAKRDRDDAVTQSVAHEYRNVAIGG